LKRAAASFTPSRQEVVALDPFLRQVGVIESPMLTTKRARIH
jgi:hypothetical protein